MQISYSSAEAALNGLIGLLEAGNCEVQVFAGSIPANCEASDAGATLLAVMPMTAGTGAFGAPSDQNPGARVDAAAITPDADAVGAGTISFFRIKSTPGGVCFIQGTAGTVGTEDAVFTGDGTVAVNDTVEVSTLYIQMPES